MTDPINRFEDDDGEALQQERPVIRDRRRLDPETGAVRHPEQAAAGESAQHGRHAASVHSTEVTADGATSEVDDSALGGAAAQLAAERLEDLQRLQAEYVNYRKRVERDRALAREGAVSAVLEALLPVLDDVHLARQHGDLEGGPFAAIAEKLEGVLARFGLERYGETGEEFDPAVHEALMHAHSPDVKVSTVTQVLQPGYKVAGRVLRAARVAVTDPEVTSTE